MPQDRDAVDCCVSCLEPVESDQGIINIDENGFCESCAARLEYGRIIREEDARSLDFDYSMNY